MIATARTDPGRRVRRPSDDIISADLMPLSVLVYQSIVAVVGGGGKAWHGQLAPQGGGSTQGSVYTPQSEVKAI